MRILNINFHYKPIVSETYFGGGVEAICYLTNKFINEEMEGYSSVILDNKDSPLESVIKHPLLSKKALGRFNFKKKEFEDYLETIKDNFDAVIMHHSIHKSFIESVVKVFQGKTVMLLLHGDINYFGDSEFCNYLAELRSNNSNFNIGSVSNGTRNLFLDKFNLELDFVLPNFVLDKYITKPSSFKQRQKNVIYCGRFDKDKNIDVFVNLANRLKGTDFKFQVIGDHETEYYKTLTETMDLSNIQFLGKKSQQELWSHFKESHILVVPNRVETFSNVGYEAQKCGMYLVYLDYKGYSGISEYCKHNSTGLRISTYRKGSQTIVRELADSVSRLPFCNDRDNILDSMRETGSMLYQQILIETLKSL